jgi:hypothetical protein
MFKYLLIWFLANYSYENISNTYKTYKQDNPIREMSEFIQLQQYREDQLRKQCQLQFYMIEPPTSMYDNVYNNVYEYIAETIQFPKLLLSHKSYKQLIYGIQYKQLYMEVLEARTMDEFINLSYNSVNIGKQLVLEETSYTLLQNGIKETNTFNYANQMNIPMPRKPTWSVKVGNQTLTVSDIK